MINRIVNHIVWGQGKILSFSERYIKILFDNPEVGEKTFVYPDAFSKYIRYADEERQEQVEEELRQILRAAEERAALAEKERNNVAESRKNEKKLQSMKRRAIAYSRKRAERLRVKSNAASDDADMTDETKVEVAENYSNESDDDET